MDAAGEVQFEILVWVDLSFQKTLAINVFCEGFHEKIAKIAAADQEMGT